ncbi:MAG: phospho-sugar mutase [Verrucomicrobiota bacterium]|nr:phospho-sugar mutase [Verrucomicrobiota bacterium]
MSDLIERIHLAREAGHLLESSANNLLSMLEKSESRFVRDSVNELVAAEAWGELDDRFFKTLAFGTGGLRGRTIGKLVTAAEKGRPQPLDRPEFPCVGTNAMNFYNVSRSTQGLVAYLKEWFAANGLAGRPKLAIAHDTRHFSRDFTELTARVAMGNGVDVFVFEGPRSTPQLSFMVRHVNASAGIVITASHNPPHDNGYKVYFSDGAQVVEPHARGIIARVNAVESDVYPPLPEKEQGRLTILGREADEAYMARLETLILDRALIGAAKALKIVFTSIHGTGGIVIKPMLERLGFQSLTVPEQEVPDGRFPTVASPNPENADALAMAVRLAKTENADLVLATDPDCDRMGVAVRTASGEMQLLTGNQIGSLMAYYRVKKLLEQGVLTKENAGRAVIIKTLVTTDLQNAIAEQSGLRCVETLTGFKYIGEKLGKYESALPAEVRAKYREFPESETRALRLQHSSYYVCGGEESYGYSAADFVRDKDGNGAAVVFAEVAAYAKSRGLTLDQLLDEVYAEFGFYFEKNGSMTFEGAEGAAQIQELVKSYATNPPREADGIAVNRARNFATETFYDSEGDEIPKEKMLMIDLTDGRRIAVRPSGTEPKIKFYLFARRTPQAGERFGSEQLADIKQQVIASLEELWVWIQTDAKLRLTR